MPGDAFYLLHRHPSLFTLSVYQSTSISLPPRVGRPILCEGLQQHKFWPDYRVYSFIHINYKHHNTIYKKLWTLQKISSEFFFIKSEGEFNPSGQIPLLTKLNSIFTYLKNHLNLHLNFSLGILENTKKETHSLHIAHCYYFN